MEKIIQEILAEARRQSEAWREREEQQLGMKPS